MTERAAGYYNHNVVVERGSAAPVIVRAPIPDAAEMDLRLWPEARLMKLARAVGIPVPEVLYVSELPPFEVHEFIPGERLDDVAPKGTPLPTQVIPDLVDAIVRLESIKQDVLPSVPFDWPHNGDTVGMANLMLCRTEAIYQKYKASYAVVYKQLGVPEDPLRSVRERLPDLQSRPFRALHCDLHRKNCILLNGVTWILDWELALWGDPLYEVAVHLHKMEYLPDELAHVRARLSGRGGLSEEVLVGFDGDLDVLLEHERCKSVVVDAVRYAEQVRDPETLPTVADQLCVKLAKKVARAQEVWQAQEPPSVERVREILSLSVW
jgi:aminoglycoside phosphotransferase (APT) family kinase protein